MDVNEPVVEETTEKNTYGIEPESYAELEENHPKLYKNTSSGQSPKNPFDGGGGSANPLEPYPLFPKATKTTEVFVYEELEYMGFLFEGLDLSGVNEDTVFKLTIGETTDYYPFSSYYKESINFNSMWVFPTEGKIFFSTNESMITAEVELDVMPCGFVDTFVINGTWGDDGIITDKSKSDFSDYCYKWGSKSRVALLIVGDSDYLCNEVIYVGNALAFVNREESIVINGSTESLSVSFNGFKWTGDNTVVDVAISV